MRKFLLLLALPLVAHAELPPVNKHVFEITKTYNPHYRTIYEVRVNESVCEFYTLDPLRIYWRNAKKGDRVEELDSGEHDRLDPVWVRKTAQQLEFHVKSMKDFRLNYPITIDLVRTGDKCEPLVSGQNLKKLDKVHVIIKFWRARQLIISGTGLDGRPHRIQLQIN